jgi:DUF1680 family protein
MSERNKSGTASGTGETPVPRRRGLTDTSQSPHVELHGVGFGDVRWTSGGFWADRVSVCRQSMMPTMGRMMRQTDGVRYVTNFLVAAGKAEGEHHGPKWNDGDFYKWFESVAALHGADPDPALDAMMDEIIPMIAAAQEPDGYIHTDITIRQRNGEKVPRFDNPMDFEMYNFGHLMVAACVHHRATGKDSLLKIAIRAAEYLDKEFRSPTPKQARHGICPIHLSGLVELYRETRERRYLDLSLRLLNMRDLVVDGDDDNQDRIPFRQQTEAIGHGVRGTYLYTGAADIYSETGDESLLAPLQKIWHDLVTKKLYITGGCGALYDGASPDGTENQAVIRRVHQSFGRPYQLPQSTAHNETCAAIGNLLWNWRMLQITGEAKYADIVELTLFNSVLAGISLDGTRFFYTNTLRNLHPMPITDLRWPRSRQKNLDCFCCPPNVVRTVAEVAQYAYGRTNDGVAVLMYGANRLDTALPDGSPIELEQETHYPWDGHVKITVRRAPSREMSLKLRIPQWASGAEVRVNGSPIAEAPQAGTFCEIRRKWSAGDVVELELPMPPRLVEANPFVEEARNQAAVVSGPIVYCLESVDLPNGVRVSDVFLPRDMKLTPQRDESSPFVALRGRALALPAGKWSDDLYREVAATPARPIDVLFVPYFAWDNRGESEMTVFLPLAQ